MIALMSIVLLASMAVSVFAASASADEDGINTYADIRADSYTVATSRTITYTIYAEGGTEPVGFVATLRDSNGSTVGSVSAGGRTTVDMDGVTLTVTAPSTAGTYTLNVRFTYTDVDETTTVTKTAPLTVVTPIRLSATIDNSAGGAIVNMDVWFVVNGERVVGSDRMVNIDAGARETITYDWATEGLSKGAHWMMLEGQVGPIPQMAPGLNEMTTFYVGQNDYSLIETILIILFIVLLIVLFIVYRKPVKNFGKPKSRR